MIKRQIIAVAISIFVISVCLNISPPVHAKELVIAFSDDIPPFVTDKGKAGLEIEIVREALKYKGHSFTTIQCSYKRLEIAVANMGTDAAAGVRQTDDRTYYSDYFIGFKNFAITKRKSGIALNSVSDLKGKHIIAWQNAYKDLGPEFESLFSPTVKESYINKYSEIWIQEKQVEMFWLGRADVIIIDESIFKWFTKKLSENINTSEEIVYHNIFPEKTEFQVNFRDEKTRDDFNEGLRYIREKGIYQGIFDNYLK